MAEQTGRWRNPLALAGAVAALVFVACAPAVTVTSDPQPQPAVVATATPMETSEMEMRIGDGLAWGDLNVPGFDPGAKIAVLHGNPAGRGDYTIRLQFPAGYRFPVHWHPGAEHLTVLSGQFLLAMGSTANASAIRTYAPGDFLYIPARHPHYGGANGPTVIQLHGIGPFDIKLGAP